MMSRTKISRGDGAVRVELQIDKYGIYLHTMQNGRQWPGGTIIEEHIPMIFEVLKEYLEKKDSEKCPTQLLGMRGRREEGW